MTPSRQCPDFRVHASLKGSLMGNAMGVTWDATGLVAGARLLGDAQKT